MTDDTQIDALKIAAAALLADVRRRYPGEDLRCEYMIALDAAINAIPSQPTQSKEQER